MSSTNFTSRHIGPTHHDSQEMLRVMGVQSIDQLIDQTVPAIIRNAKSLAISNEMSEHDYLSHMWGKAKKNRVNKSYMGMGYHPTIVPSVILRNILVEAQGAWHERSDLLQ